MAGMLELGDRPIESEVTAIITEAVLAELAPEWFTPKWGAGWWIDKATTLPTSSTLQVIDPAFLEGAANEMQNSGGELVSRIRAIPNSADASALTKLAAIEQAIG